MVRLFQQQLSNLEAGLRRVEEDKIRMELEVRALRNHISVVCLSSVLQLAHHAVLRAQWWANGTVAAAQLRLFANQVLSSDPSVESNLAGVYFAVRLMHTDCPHCIQDESKCGMGASLLVLRDTLVIAATIGKGTMDHLILKALLDGAMRMSCGREMDKVERSQLTLSFHKVLLLGKTRFGFDEAMRDPKLFGVTLTDEQVDALFLVYNSCWQASPAYISKNKASKKHKPKRGKPEKEDAGGETDGCGEYTECDTDWHNESEHTLAAPPASAETQRLGHNVATAPASAETQSLGSASAQPSKLFLSASAMPWTPGVLWQGASGVVEEAPPHASAITGQLPVFLPSFGRNDNGASATGSGSSHDNAAASTGGTGASATTRHAVALAAGSSNSHGKGAAMLAAPPGLSEPLPR